MTIHYDDLFATGKGPNAPRGRVARGRHTPGKMNSLESEYATQLEYQRLQGEIAWWRFEGITLKLADDCRLTPDFFVMLNNGELECRETKGHWQEDAKIKMRVAASLYPFRFIAVHKIPKKDGGGWKIIDF